MLTLFSGRHFMHVRRALALTLAVPVLLAGCTDDPEPTPKMPEPTSSSPSPEPTETEEPEAESPEEFIRRWVEVSNDMQGTGDVDAYLSISGKCRPCREVAQQVSAAFDAGGYVRTKGWTVRDVTDRSGGGKPIYDVRVDSAPTVVKASKSAKPSRLPGGELVYRLRLNAQAPWQLMTLTQVPS